MPPNLSGMGGRATCTPATDLLSFTPTPAFLKSTLVNVHIFSHSSPRRPTREEFAVRSLRGLLLMASRKSAGVVIGCTAGGIL